MHRLLLGALALGILPAAHAQTLAFPRYPVLSPDGRTIAFSWQGDIWSAPVDKPDQARRLTIHPGYDRPIQFSPDGTRLLFQSNRLGRNDAWVMPAAGGTPAQLTHFSGGSNPLGWSPDGKRVLLASVRELQTFGPAFYTVAASDNPGRPKPLIAVARMVGGQLSPDGKSLVFVRGSSDWPRRGYRGEASADLYLHPIGSKQAKRLTDFDGQDLWPQWLPGGRELVYVSERDGTYNLWRLDLASGKSAAITKHRGDGVRFPSVAASGSRVAYEIADRIEILDLASGAAPKPFAPSAPADYRRNPVETLTVSSGATEVEPSPDGEQIALVARGDVFAAMASGGKAVQITDAPQRDSDIAWGADGKSLVFITRRDGNPEIYSAVSDDPDEPRIAKARKHKLVRLTRTSERESAPTLSPDGKQMAFLRDDRSLWVAAPDGTAERKVASAYGIDSIAWSPDSRWIAFTAEDEEYNNEVMVVLADGTAPARNVSMHPRNDGNPAWSPDGTKLFFLSERVDRETDVWMVWLRKADDERTAEEWARLREKARAGNGAGAGAAAPVAKPAPKEVAIDFDGIHKRVRRLTTLRGDEQSLAVGGDASRTTVAVRISDDANDLALIDLPEGASTGTPKRIAAGGVGALRWSKDGKSLWLLRASGLAVLATGADAPRPVAWRAKAAVNRAAFQAAIYDEAWLALDRQFYDPKFHGADWPALRERYRPMAMAASDPADFGDVVRLLMGHLNASHIGYSPARDSEPDAPAPPTGFVGLVWDENHAGPGLKVARAVAGSPAAAQANKIEPGEVVLSIDDQPLAADTDPDSLLADKVGETVYFQVRATDGKTRRVVLIPTSYAGLNGLLYDEMVEARRAETTRLSGGKIAYQHIRGMDKVSQDAFEQALYAEGYGKDSLLIDVRDNGGGSTADYLLTMLSIPRHAFTIGRDGAPGYPQDRLPLYPWHKPAALLINERAYSNAEIFAHAFRGLGRGPVIGVPTFGAVISTGAAQLLDGSAVRTPLRGWYRIWDGVNHEHTGAEPDTRVDRTPEDELNGRDPQLEAGVKALLAKGKGKALPSPQRPRYEGTDRK
jgi:tricorn protease